LAVLVALRHSKPTPKTRPATLEKKSAKLLNSSQVPQSTRFNLVWKIGWQIKLRSETPLHRKGREERRGRTHYWLSPSRSSPRGWIHVWRRRHAIIHRRGFPGKPGFRPRTPARLRLAHAREAAQYSSCQRTNYEPLPDSPATAGSRLPKGPRLASESLDADTSRLRRQAAQSAPGHGH